MPKRRVLEVNDQLPVRGRRETEETQKAQEKPKTKPRERRNKPLK